MSSGLRSNHSSFSAGGVPVPQRRRRRNSRHLAASHQHGRHDRARHEVPAPVRHRENQRRYRLGHLPTAIPPEAERRRVRSMGKRRRLLRGRPERPVSAFRHVRAHDSADQLRGVHRGAADRKHRGVQSGTTTPTPNTKGESPLSWASAGALTPRCGSRCTTSGTPVDDTHSLADSATTHTANRHPRRHPRPRRQHRFQAVYARTLADPLTVADALAFQRTSLSRSPTHSAWPTR